MISLQTTQTNIPPNMIDLGIGQPSPTLLPLDVMQKAVQHRLQQGDPSLLAYGAEQGDGYFRLALAKFLTKGYAIPVDADSLFVTSGASQALDLICTLCTKPGDTVFVEEPSYFLALRIFADHGLHVVGLPMDGDGLDIAVLAEKLTEYRPQFLYTVPTHHNPSSLTLSAERRQQLVELSEQHGFFIVADEVYQLLGFDAAPPPPLINYDRSGTVLSIGSFSKILAPGLRLGWLQARPQVLEPFINCGLLDSGGGLNPFTSGIVRSVLELDLLSDYVDKLKTVYRHRAKILSAALRRQLSETAVFDEPTGGFFIWLRFPETIDLATLLPELIHQHVRVQPGVKFSAQGRLRNCARLCFAYYDAEALAEGVNRLAQVVTKKA
ncbi:MAG: PLP-dependent aminotransferase family protein [Anaerolineae bacterium]|nr:PLP-dependent aminotransferase family protein [Anaerolineae bacterium]